MSSVFIPIFNLSVRFGEVKLREKEPHLLKTFCPVLAFTKEYSSSYHNWYPVKMTGSGQNSLYVDRFSWHLFDIISLCPPPFSFLRKKITKGPTEIWSLFTYTVFFRSMQPARAKTLVYYVDQFQWKYVTFKPITLVTPGQF